jgi:hypothetical protein
VNNERRKNISKMKWVQSSLQYPLKQILLLVIRQSIKQLNCLKFSLNDFKILTRYWKIHDISRV